MCGDVASQVGLQFSGDYGPVFPALDAYGTSMQQNMGKRGISVDIKDPRGAELIGRLIHTADVFVENYRPGALDKFGLGYEDLSERNPGLVYCSISAYGHTGPDSAQAGFGLIAEAKSGGMSMLGEPGEAPPLYGLSLADMYTGIHGVAAVNAALIGKMKTGLGSYLDLALYDCMVSMHEYAVQQYTLSGGTVLPQQMGHDLPHSTVYGVFTGSDGHFVLAAQVDESWKRLAQLIGGEKLATDPRYQSLEGRNADRAHIRELIEAWAKAQSSVRSCLDQLDAAHVPCAKVQTIDEVVNDPQIHRPQHDHRARPPGAGEDPDAQPPLQHLLLRHHPPTGRPDPGRAQRRGRDRARLFGRRHRRHAARRGAFRGTRPA